MKRVLLTRLSTIAEQLEAFARTSHLLRHLVFQRLHRPREGDSIDAVHEWMATLGLTKHYSEIVYQNSIDGNTYISMDPAQWTSIGLDEQDAWTIAFKAWLFAVLTGRKTSKTRVQADIYREDTSFGRQPGISILKRKTPEN